MPRRALLFQHSSRTVGPAIVLGLSSTVLAQHNGDISLTTDDGQIMTGAITSGGVLPSRVFPAAFGKLGILGWTNDPGFESPSGTWPSGSSIGFNILEPLQRWNGDGFDALDSDTEETLRLSFANNTLNATTDDRFVPGFELGVSGTGGYHRHLNFNLQGPSGVADDAVPGIYLLTLEKYSTSASFAPTEPFWLVFRHEDSEINQQAAVDWVIANLAEPPTCVSDLNGDQTVNVLDLLTVLGAWGENPGHPADLNGDQLVNVLDLLEVLGAWGPCP